VDEMLDITNDYRKHVMNKFCHTALLPDGCVPLQVGGKAANTNWELAAHPQQLMRSTLYVRGHYWMQTDDKACDN